MSGGEPAGETRSLGVGSDVRLPETASVFAGDGSPTGASVLINLIVAAALVGLGGLAWHAQRSFSFVVDEWDILAHHVHGHLLTPYNGHLSLVPIVIYQGLAHTVGIGSYRPYGTIGILVFLAIPAVFFLTHRRVVDPALAAVGTLAIAWSWAAQMNLLYGFLVNFDLPLLMLVISWWLIRRDRLRDDLWAVVAVTIALASSSVGVVVAVAVGVELVIGRARVRRLVRFAPPMILWVAWWVARHEPTAPASFGARATYAWHMVVGILAGFTLGWKPGAVLVAVAIAAIGWMAWRRWHTIDAHVLAIAIALGFFVALSAFSRAGEIDLNPPDASRYVWMGDVLIVAALVWCVRGRRVPIASTVAAAALVVVGGVALLGHTSDHRSYILDYTARTRPFLLGAEMAGPAADPTRILPLNLIPVTVSEYLDLVATVGSPVAGRTPADLGSAPARSEADGILASETRITSRFETGAPRCIPTKKIPASSHGDIAVDAGTTLVIVAPKGASIRLRRLAGSFGPQAALTLPPGTTVHFTGPDDHREWPWHVALHGAGATAALCAAS